MPNISKVILNGVTQMDVTSTTATPKDVVQSKIFFGADGTQETGEKIVTRPKQINFFDYDGILLYSYTKEELLALSSLPDNPSHTGLTAQGWNWTLTDITSFLATNPDVEINVGQLYITDDEKTRIYIHLEEWRSPTLDVGGTCLVDWGDGSPVVSNNNQSINHTYTASGDYIISLTPTGNGCSFYGSQDASGDDTQSLILTSTPTAESSYFENLPYRQAIQKIEIGSNMGISTFAFYDCAGLEYITLPIGSITYNILFDCQPFVSCSSLKHVTLPPFAGITDHISSIQPYAFFQNCYSLRSICLPLIHVSSDITEDLNVYLSGFLSGCSSLQHITLSFDTMGAIFFSFYGCSTLTKMILPNNCQISSESFRGCHSLKEVTGYSSFSNSNDYAFYNCSNLAKISIPNGVTTISYGCFQSCYNLQKLTIPSSVTSIERYAISLCYGLKELHFQSSTPPTVANSSSINIPTTCIIYVPVGSLTTYTSATNYPSSSSYTYIEE